MALINRFTSLLLLLGDLVIFNLALWFALWLRYGGWPDRALFLAHFQPFAIVFVIWLAVFLVFDLYRPALPIFKRRLPEHLLKAQLVNTLAAIAFFYFLPGFGITPKTILFIDLVISFVLIWLWRWLALRLWRQKTRLLFFATGEPVEELKQALDRTDLFKIVSLTDLAATADYPQGILVINPYAPEFREALPMFYERLAAGHEIFSVIDLYEMVFGRVPLELINEQWFIEHISNQPKPIYDLLKRLMDLVLALSLGLVSLLVYPVVWLAIKLDSAGSVFITQTRVGEKNQEIKVHKFRSMTTNDQGRYDDRPTRPAVNQVTWVGRWLRLLRLDELPQLFDVAAGRLSLIGPRPELPALTKQYTDAIPFYNIRHLIKPGLSGWAQIYHDRHPHHGVDVVETKHKLSYDLYYIRNRSFGLDLEIALKTVKVLLSVAGE